MLLNNSFSTVDKNVSNLAEFVFGALHVDGFFGKQGVDESYWGGELSPLNIYLALILLAKVSKLRWSWTQS